METISDYEYLRQKQRPHLIRNGNTLRVVDFYAGVGSLSLGVWEACRRLKLDFECAAAVDLNTNALDVYSANFQGARIFLRDMTTLIDGSLGMSASPKERSFLKTVGSVDIMLSGSPCQSFSSLNYSTRWESSRNALYLRAVRFAEIGLPEHCLIENVPDVVNGREDVVGISLDKFRELGYHYDSAVIDLSDIGLPQTRKRHIIIASLSKRVNIGNMIARSRVKRKRSVKWAIDDLKNRRPVSMYDIPSRQSETNRTRIKYLYDSNSFDLPTLLRPACHKSRKKSKSYKAMYGRMHYDIPSRTITGGFSSPGQGRFIHPVRERMLTPHEAARLQFFPDYFDFSSVRLRRELARMIGNAAPMNLSLNVTRWLLE